MIRQLLPLLCVALVVSGCATSRPPADVVKAIGVINAQTDVYVRESNWALDAAQHPDATLLKGTGERLRNAISALNAWAQQQAGK